MSINKKKGRTMTKIAQKRAILTKLASSLFEPEGKNPYYMGDGRAIKNLTELKENLDSLSDNEAHWLASWIEYLGDEETAKRIRAAPDTFKAIINERYTELMEFYHKR